MVTKWQQMCPKWRQGFICVVSSQEVKIKTLFIAPESALLERH